MATVPVRKLSRDAHRRRLHARVRHTRHGQPGAPASLRVPLRAAHSGAGDRRSAAGATLASASSLDKEVKKTIKGGGNIAAAKVVGKTIAERARAAGVEKVVFDRGGYQYHGRVQALAEAAREAGLKF